jgi:hypothetical protein
MKFYLSKRSYILAKLLVFNEELNKLADSVTPQNIGIKRELFWKIRSKLVSFVRNEVSKEEAEILDPGIIGIGITRDPVKDFFREYFKPLQDKLIALVEALRAGHVAPDGFWTKPFLAVKKFTQFVCSDWRMLFVVLGFIIVLVFTFRLPQKIMNVKKIGLDGVEFFQK